MAASVGMPVVRSKRLTSSVRSRGDPMPWISIGSRMISSTVMRGFALRTWNERHLHPDGSFLRYFWKIWGNSAYGKTVEGVDKDEIVVHPDHTLCKTHRKKFAELSEEHRGEPKRIARAWREFLLGERGEKRCGCLFPVVPTSGLYACHFEREPAFRAPWAGAAILAIARVRLFDEILLPPTLNGGRITYADTDAGIISGPYKPEVGEELGDLALERTIDDGRFLAPKLYAYRCLACDKERDHPHDVVKAKGFPRLSRVQFDSLEKCGCREGYRPGTALGCPACGGRGHEPGTGRAILTFERTEGLKEALARGRTDYRRIFVTKGFRDVARPKRADGGARPWTIDELSTKYVPVPRVSGERAA